MTTDERSSRRRLPLSAIGAAAALLWAAALVFYYWLGQWHAVELPDGSTRIVGLWAVFGSLTKGFSLGGGSFPLPALLGGIIALWLFALLGKVFLLCFPFYAPPRAQRCLEFLCGISLVAILLEPLAIFGALWTPWVWLTLLAALLVMWRVSYKVQRRPPPEAGALDDARVYRRAQRTAAREDFERSLIRPRGFFGLLFHRVAWLLIAIITFLTFWHGLLYPETYWDSLILYLGYARMTFLEQAFPVKVVAQVGIGLGANYPHLFPLLGASAASMWGHWSPVYQQLMTPLAGLVSTILLYHVALRLTRHVNFSLACALIYRAIPYGIAYNIWSSDYAIIMALAAGFLWLALLYIETNLIGYLIALTLLTAAGTRVNYLMWLFWGLWCLTVAAAHWRPAWRWEREWRRPLDSDEFTSRDEPDFTRAEPRISLRSFTRKRRFWTILVCGLLLSLPWVARNWIVTGNPFYAFFPSILGGKHINPEVLDSAFGEWRANGDGIGVVAEQLYGSNNIIQRVRATFSYFITWQSNFPNFWKIAPVFVAFVIPALVFWIMGAWRENIAEPRPRPFRPEVFRLNTPERFGLVAAAMVFLHLFYFYFLGDFYLYQIIAILPASAALAALWPVPLWGRLGRFAFGALALAVGVFPGLPAALMGPKLPDDNLTALRRPFPATAEFWATTFPGEWPVIQWINANLKDAKLLTHENRHLLFDPSIALVHLDDWDVQALYDIPSPHERADRLKAMGVRHYLRVPMEFKHRVNQRLGMDELIAANRLRLMREERDRAGNPVALYHIE